MLRIYLFTSHVSLKDMDRNFWETNGGGSVSWIKSLRDRGGKKKAHNRSMLTKANQTQPLSAVAFKMSIMFIPAKEYWEWLLVVKYELTVLGLETGAIGEGTCHTRLASWVQSSDLMWR